ncbi:3-oxoacid CoA-transferase/3-oxoacid CoA-transferase subunit B [Thalassobacillus cyri]|uniref:3-oxoacid CoA-transferase/3-oxoacid CoA-transferase subunit B n=1 Tax=Thalassobacillus cyri TaxID=571932 RepID=A0A1H4AAS2_9BACI|nr:3-oxoacid CoA-transferase subunit B [Thalassobacillus cyri]SEA32594.1 3-oxoacid CoA-transferase/3-oxoacid CoA-transferase subunit B [Thalassobacillus cyri]
MSQAIRLKIAKKVSELLVEGNVVNLGIGIPTLIPDCIGDKNVYLQSENGILGMGATPADEETDMDLISANKQPVSLNKGASIFDSADSFSMIRGGHIDLAVLGALQVDETGEIANWAIPGKAILGVGGAMDLVMGAQKIIIATTHLTKDGNPKIVNKLTYPSSGKRKVDMIVTEHALFKFISSKMYLMEVLSDISFEELKQITPASYEISSSFIAS